MIEHAGIFPFKHVNDDICIEKILQKSSPIVSVHGMSEGSLNDGSFIQPKREKKSSE